MPDVGLPSTGTTKPTQRAARYTPAGGRERCGACRHFWPSTSCKRIQGPITARGWCRYFSQEVVASIYQPGATAAGGGPSLDISFITTPGVLDPRIAFTRASTATYFNASGTMQTAAANAPRFDYDPVTHVALGLLIEEPRTNSYRNAQFTGGVTGSPGTAPTNMLIIPPSGGTVTASIVGLSTVNGVAVMDVRFVGNVVGSALRVYFDSGTTAAANAQVWTMSNYVALVGGTVPAGYYPTLALDMTNAGSTYLGSLTSAQLATPTATLTRQSAASTLNQATTAFITTFYQASMSDGAVDFTLRFAMPQLELGAFPTSYIPTTAAVVTRAADVATMPTAAWFSAGSGTYQGEYSALTVTPGRVLQASDASGANTDILFSIATTKASGNTFAAGVNQGRIDSGVAVVPLQIVKAAYAVSATQRAICANGGAVATSATAARPASVPTLNIGCDNGNTTQLNGYIRRVRYWPRALSNAELQSVTT